MSSWSWYVFNPEYKSPDLIKQQRIICEIKAENLLILMDYAILYLSNVFWKYARLCFYEETDL